MKKRSRRSSLSCDEDKFDETVVTSPVAITRAEENEFKRPVLKYAAQTKNPGLAAAQVVVQRQVQVR